ncbi:JAB domain-containing protein [Flavobacterium sp. 3HN19-14]|uniref:JAB domain-containing protein n=1 Tax=Flavobacterium sp. 3HN19-14 TaxID=3448133 RepID=UPI003EE17225
MVSHNMDFTKKVAEVELVYKSDLQLTDRPKIKSSIDAYEIFYESWDMNKIEMQEQFSIMLLDNANTCLCVSTIATGSINSCMVDLRLAFAAALKARATSMILAHNHPSGNTTFSDNDKWLTRKFAEAGKILDIKILDHILITNSRHASLADEGLMPS